MSETASTNGTPATARGTPPKKAATARRGTSKAGVRKPLARRSPEPDINVRVAAERLILEAARVWPGTRYGKLVVEDAGESAVYPISIVPAEAREGGLIAALTFAGVVMKNTNPGATHVSLLLVQEDDTEVAMPVPTRPAAPLPPKPSAAEVESAMKVLANAARHLSPVDTVLAVGTENPSGSGATLWRQRMPSSRYDD